MFDPSDAEIPEPFGPKVVGPPVEEASPGDEPCFPVGRGPGRVALLEHPDPLCRQRTFVGLCRDGHEHAYEVVEEQTQSLVDSLLARHIGVELPPNRKIRFVDDTSFLSTIQYFDVPDGSPFQALALRTARILKGEVAGLYGEALRQSAFHTAHGAFELLWKAAGCPPIIICRGQHTMFPALSGGWGED